MVLGPHPAALMAYSLFCTQVLLLDGSRGSFEVLGIEPRLAMTRQAPYPVYSQALFQHFKENVPWDLH